jgi:ABC-type multidrug transport system permease subunit
VKEAFRRSVSNALEMIIQSTETRLFLACFFDELPKMIDNKANDALIKEVDYFIGRTEQEMNRKLKDVMGDYAPDYIELERPDSMNVNLEKMLQQSLEIDLTQHIQNLAPVSMGYAGTGEDSLQPSMTQNNIPGFALFAMFFIVIPLAGSILTEKEQGTFTRLKTLPVSYFNILWGKIITYVAVCFLQFFLMVLIGMYVFPLAFGLPALEIGSQVGMIILVTLVSGLSAVGFGMIIGSLSGTHNQAAMVGSILVIILSALGGLFMPVYMMPGSLKAISMFSPIRWGVDAYLDVFVRNAGMSSIWWNLLLLLLFFAGSMILTVKMYTRKA